MCQKCERLDAIIARYQRLKNQIDDRQALQAASDLVAKLEAEKHDLHPALHG